MERVLTFALLCALSALGQMKPSDVQKVDVINQTETELTLQWNIVDNITNYELTRDGKNESIPVSDTDTRVTHTVSSLTSGTNYSFILYTVREGVSSKGYEFFALTVPSRVDSVSVVGQSDTTITLQWNEEPEKPKYSYELKYGEVEKTIPASDKSPVQYDVESLDPGTKYSFTLYTVFGNLRSIGYSFSNVTAPADVEKVWVIDRNESTLTLQWIKDKDEYTFELKRNNVKLNVPPTDSPVNYTVMSLSPGTAYEFTLYTVFEGLKSHGYIFSEVTVPSNVANVSVVDVNDTDVMLQWNDLANIDNRYKYILKNKYGEETAIPETGNEVTHHVSGLVPATNYSFTLYTEYFDVRSTGFNFYHRTSLSDITEVRVTRSVTELIIEWNKLNQNDIYNYTLTSSDGAEEDFIGSALEGDVIKYTHSSLTPGSERNFTLFAVSNNFRSHGYPFKNITTLDCASFNWEVTNSSIDAEVKGCTDVTAKSSSGSDISASVHGNKVDLQNLYPGESYDVSLFFDLESKKLLQCSQHLTLFPNSVSNLHCKYHSGGYGLAIIWDHPTGIVDVVEVDVNKKSSNHSGEVTQQLVTGLQAAQWYKVTATSISKAKTSETISINCQTDPAGVIAGVLVFFLLVIIICAGVFVWIRYRSGKRNSNKPVQPVGPKAPKKTYKKISSDKFPEHFRNMSRDDNRAFSVEYEELGSVGVDQSTVAALLPENKEKNRFSNVLPYDSSRVDLTTKTERDSDYINANYMPGYGNASRQYIAAQGPLPSTVNDFWRMIWEQKSSAIVMVTNCTEGGRVKCEQYWPLDYTPCLYGNLLVTVKSENKSQSWTLREFNVKNKMTSEARTVRHFHFTAWRDHGVPSGTEDLIQFRGLVRQHIESSFSSGPTVVHCSAGVGRTGTLIALDVLLQQLNRENGVGIAAFIQEMRYSRPLMVQTESQYVFLHQCILDSLQPKFVPQSEPIYENTDTIYVNAVALREFEQASKT